jgi:hypothetical protein
LSDIILKPMAMSIRPKTFKKTTGRVNVMPPTSMQSNPMIHTKNLGIQLNKDKM